MKNQQQGFTLFEVLVAMFIATVAVLGLVLLELTILRSAQSSLNYTLATIEANTLADKLWMNLCDIKGTSAPNEAIYTALYSGWVGDLSSATATTNFTSFTGSLSDSVATLAQNDTITVSWVDKNFAANAANDQAILKVNFPDFSGSCL